MESVVPRESYVVLEERSVNGVPVERTYPLAMYNAACADLCGVVSATGKGRLVLQRQLHGGAAIERTDVTPAECMEVREAHMVMNMTDMQLGAHVPAAAVLSATTKSDDDDDDDDGDDIVPRRGMFKRKYRADEHHPDSADSSDDDEEMDPYARPIKIRRQ
jgi:hypothetical protein